jgi:hypothetical protein
VAFTSAIACGLLAEQLDDNDQANGLALRGVLGSASIDRPGWFEADWVMGNGPAPIGVADWRPSGCMM